MLFLTKQKMLSLTKKQKTKNTRIFAFLIKKQKKQKREPLLFLTTNKTKKNRIVDFLNKKTHKKNTIR